MLKIKRKHILLVALLSILVVIIAFAGAHFAFKPLIIVLQSTACRWQPRKLTIYW